MATGRSSLGRRIQRQAALIGKETVQLLRDRRTLAIMLSLPLIELFLVGYAVHLTVDHLPTVVADLSKDDRSRAFVSAMTNSQYFDVVATAGSEDEAVAAIDEGRAKAGLVIPPDFAARMDRGEAQVLVLLDGSDSFSVTSGYTAAVAVGQERALVLAVEQAMRVGLTIDGMPITTSTRVLYNPGQQDLVFVMPGLIGVLVQLMAVTATAQAMVREYELGTMEQLMATPSRPLEIVIGKLVPRMALALLVTAMTTLVGVYWFGVPFQGSPWAFGALSILFAIAGLGLGLLVSSIAHTQKEAMQITILITLLSVLLTGFFFPRASMPAAARFIGSLMPLTYYLRLIRGIITKGVDVSLMWGDVVVLAVYATVITICAGLTTRKRLG